MAYTVGITSCSHLAGSASHLEDLEINTHSHYRHPWHFQELKVNGKEFIVLNPHLDVPLGNTLLGEAKFPVT